LSNKPEKEKETQVSSMNSGNRKAAKLLMFHAAEVLIERDGPHCILQNAPSGKFDRKEDPMDSRKVML